jgi:hypothetical protein
MTASLVKVTVNVAFGPTTSGVVSVWAVPLVDVAKFHVTSLVVDEHPV